MVDVILNFIDFNEGVDYDTVLRTIVGYLIVLWIFVSIWVFNDAKQRFSSVLLATVIALLNLFMNFPFLLIYLLARPAHRDELEYWHDGGGVNVPLVNFTGKDGVAMSIELKIHPNKTQKAAASEMKIDVSFDENAEMQIIQPVAATEPMSKNLLKSFFDKIKLGMTKMVAKLKDLFGSAKTKLNELKEDNEPKKQTASGKESKKSKKKKKKNK